MSKYLKNKISQYLKLGNNTLAIQVHNHNLTSSDLSVLFFFSVGDSEVGGGEVEWNDRTRK